MELARNPAQIPMRSYGRCQLSSCISTYHQHTITAVVVDFPLCDSSIHTVVECRVYLCESGAVKRLPSFKLRRNLPPVPDWSLSLGDLSTLAYHPSAWITVCTVFVWPQKLIKHRGLFYLFCF